MHFKALATDFDGTLAADGVVSKAAIAALKNVRRSGRKLILVTGRELGDLDKVFARFDLFDRIVAENGAILHRPATGETVNLASPPPADFVALLERRGVTPLAIGRVVVATCEPYDRDMREAISTLGLDLQIIFNKGSVMALPPGVRQGERARGGAHGACARRDAYRRDRRCRERSSLSWRVRLCRRGRERAADAEGGLPLGDGRGARRRLRRVGRAARRNRSRRPRPARRHRQKLMRQRRAAARSSSSSASSMLVASR